MTDTALFGPWADGIDACERIARLRSMRALAGVFCHREREFITALASAESGDTYMLNLALQILDEIPALPRRKLLTSYCDLATTTKLMARAE